MKVLKLFILALLSTIIVSCEFKSEIDNSEMFITIGTTCGWCAGTDSLVITKTNMNYTLAAICDKSGKKISKSTPDSIWQKLNGLYDQSKFEKININTCNVCADGCDTWIRVQHGDFNHIIRFGSYQDTVLFPIWEFVEKLNDLKNEYK